VRREHGDTISLGRAVTCGIADVGEARPSRSGRVRFPGPVLADMTLRTSARNLTFRISR
jgi:hypothetical protein